MEMGKLNMSIVRPRIKIKEKTKIATSYNQISDLLLKKKNKSVGITIAIECYPVSNRKLILNKIIQPLHPDMVIEADNLFLDSKTVTKMIKNDLTEDRIFGFMSHHNLKDFLDVSQFINIKKRLKNNKEDNKLSVIYGVGASLVEDVDILIYADLSRWEIQSRYKSGQFSNWKANNAGTDVLKMIKRGYFFEWGVADRHKKSIQNNINYLLDLHNEKEPKMIPYEPYLNALEEVVQQPFSLVPFFDPGIWGGKWMQETFDVGGCEDNLAWSFNGVPEENSLLLDFNGTAIEIPANNLVYLLGEELLGSKVLGRFGHEFPIRFNILDTMEGQNLSLQVHPKVDYVQENFGAHYTQEESYYVLDAKEDAVVYLGVNNGIQKEELIKELKISEETNKIFDDQKYIYRHPMKKHDHYSIPPGTIHSSGKNSVVLEISATPNRFTFKLWDWGRVDFDGLPRPVNIDRGEPNIDSYKDESWVKAELINPFIEVNKGNGWVEERTGLHESEFIETRRHTFEKKVIHENPHGVNVISLVEGEEALVSSPDGTFDSFNVYYAQTFIIPATIKKYSIEPDGNSMGKSLKTMKAFVR